MLDDAIYDEGVDFVGKLARFAIITARRNTPKQLNLTGLCASLDVDTNAVFL